MMETQQTAVPLVDPKTLADLGFDDVVAAVRDLATFSKAKARAAAMRPIEDAGERRRVASLVAEVETLTGPAEGVEEGGALADLSHLEDPTPLIARLDKGGVLTGQELLALEKIIPAYLGLHRACRKSGGRIPAIKRMVTAAVEEDGAVERLEEISLEICAVIDEDGSIKDGATEELRQLRTRLRSLRTEISTKVKDLMETFKSTMQDDYYTIRDGRYVLPIRSEERSHVKGIIHGYSQTGATVFIEPESLVDDCNRLKITEGDIAAEEERILRRLSGALAVYAHALGKVERLLVEIDVLGAIARFGRRIGGTAARLADEPLLDLVDARHPLLALGGMDVVPNSVRLAAGQGWIISGPNAGGKTVLLKTAGLCALMAWCAIPIPARQGSAVGGFGVIRSVIGDDQSVAQNLSTFSAQVRAVTEVLGCASPTSLILLDELATGTEPQEGAALAREILLELVVEKGAAVMVATHFENLKLLSVSHERFVAAGMGFDFNTLSPTFRVTMGMPGISGGLVVASRYGLPMHIVERARAALAGGGDQLSTRIEEIERLKSNLEQEIGGLEKKKAEVSGKEKEVEAARRKLMERKHKDLTAQEAYLTTELRLIHGELKQAHTLLRRRPVSASALKSSAHTAERVSGLIAPEGKLTKLLRPEVEAKPPALEDLRPGTKVLIRKLGIHGEIEGFEGKKVRVASGGKSVVVAASDLFLGGEGQTMTKTKDVDDTPADEGREEMDEHQNPYNTLDLRGKALDEALIDIDAFIDNVTEMGLGVVYLIHGHGTGVLKNGVRRHLRHLKAVASFRPGGKNEGGDGCTVATLKER
jgi:DNA mismatch repair protein MutS2